MSYATIIYFMARWFSYGDWFAFPLTFWGVTLFIIRRLTTHQYRWWSLPFMSKPVPMVARPGWRVGVATTFVPGAESIEMLAETVSALLAMDYPHDTWVLDEGDDAQVKTLCERLGAFHFSRNFAITPRPGPSRRAQSMEITMRGSMPSVSRGTRSSRRSILTMCQNPLFLPKIGYFNDPEVGYVQAAQSSTISRRVLSPVVRLKKHMYFILPSRCPLMPLGTQS